MAGARDPDVVNRLVAPTATYVSLNFEDHDLHRIMPWCGTHEKAGPRSIIETFTNVGRFWSVESFEIECLFGDDNQAAAFGRFTYRSTVLGKRVTSPFAVLAVVKNGMVTYMRFMEDTFATASSFQSSGEVTYHSDPDGQAFHLVGAPTTGSFQNDNR